MDQRNETGWASRPADIAPPWTVTLGERSPMLKPLTLSLGLAVVFGMSGIAMAHGNDGCATCGLASSQAGPIASSQSPYIPAADCGPIESCDSCAPKCNLFSNLGGRLDKLNCRIKGLLHPPVTYEWVLKKKRLWGHKNDCGGCNECAGGEVYPTSQVIPSSQYPSSQFPSSQAAPSGQAAPVYGASQQTSYNATGYSAPTVASRMLGAEEAPPAPAVQSAGGLLLPTN